MKKHNLTFSEKILIWYNKSDPLCLPWQKNKKIYNIWISEIMLQQTQVSTVIPYYEKFIKYFPTIFLLAKSELNRVLYTWSGLGYYKRATNLYKTAKMIVKNYNGKFPQDFNTLITFPGIGKSTAGAILSLALDKPYPILDGNIKRILTRYYNLNYYKIKNIEINNNLWFLIEKLIPLDSSIAAFNQAMMNLGRLICTYTHPKCNICPINDRCQSFLTNNINQNKQIKTYIKKTYRNVWWLILFEKKKNTVFLIKRSKEKIWNKLFSFPEFHNRNDLNIWLLKYNIYFNLKNEMSIVNHKIGNITFKFQPIFININEMFFPNEKEEIWYNFKKPMIIGLPKPVSTILKTIYNKI